MKTKSSHKKKPTGAKLPKARVIKCWERDLHVAGDIPCAVLPMPTLKAAKQAVRFANMSYEQKDRAIRDALSSGSDWSYGRQPLICELSIAILALLGHTP